MHAHSPRPAPTTVVPRVTRGRWCPAAARPRAHRAINEPHVETRLLPASRRRRCRRLRRTATRVPTRPAPVRDWAAASLFLLLLRANLGRSGRAISRRRELERPRLEPRGPRRRQHRHERREDPGDTRAQQPQREVARALVRTAVLLRHLLPVLPQVRARVERRKLRGAIREVSGGVPSPVAER